MALGAVTLGAMARRNSGWNDWPGLTNSDDDGKMRTRDRSRSPQSTMAVPGIPPAALSAREGETPNLYTI
jgi:hypothetical protein